MPIRHAWFRVVSPQNVVSFLVGLFFITILPLTRTGKDSFYILALLAVVLLFINVKNTKLIPSEKVFFWVIIIGFLWTLFTFWINGSPGRGQGLIWSRQFYFIALIPLYFLFRRYTPNTNIFLAILILALFGAGLTAINDLYGWGEPWGGRAHGGTHPNYFAGITLCITAILFSVLRVCRQKGYTVLLLALCALLMAGVAIVLSNSRGVWITAPIVMGIGFWHLYTKTGVARKVVIVCIVVLLPLLLYPIPRVNHRIAEAVNNVTNFINSENYSDNARATSIGARLEMWRAAWQMFKDNPVTGVGVGGYQTTAQRYVDKGGWHPTIANFYFVHNQYLSALSTRGVPGLVIVVLHLLLPGYIFFRALNRVDGGQYYALAGLLIVVTYTVTGVVDEYWALKEPILFYSFSIALLMAKVHRPSIGTL